MVIFFTLKILVNVYLSSFEVIQSAKYCEYYQYVLTLGHRMQHVDKF